MRKMTIFCACKSLFQFTAIKMIIFCARKNLLNKKKSLKGYHNCCVKRPQKILMKGNPPQSWPWKQNGTNAVAVVMIPKVVNNWRSMSQLDFEPESSSITGKVCYHYNTWVTGVYMALYAWQKFWRNFQLQR